MACCGKLYFFSSNRLNWSSRDACVSRGADLVTIISQSEQHSSVSEQIFCQTHEMESIYENSAIFLSTVASSEECSPNKEKSTSNECVREREDTSSKRTSKITKVLLFVLGFTLVISLGGLCALWIIYTNALADSGSLKEQLSAQKLNSKTLRDDLMRELEELKDNYTHVREHLVLCVAMKEEFHDLTSRYKILRDLLSYYDAQSCNVSANGWTACRGQLYYFSTSKLNWFSSRDACVSRGADLVTITSQSEQASQTISDVNIMK
nr:uncharacterized protein LOC101885796 [Danio rerio]|eukprot:XP_021323879.1 uncharacterized protein LOC101885796 [Danio rerio]